MKRIKLLIALLLMTLLVIPNVNASDATIKITTNSTNFNPGNTITVDVTLKSSTPIGYYEYTLDYDTKSLQLLNSNSYVVNSPNDNNTKKISKSFKFKIKKKTNSKISVNSYSVVSFKGNKNLSVSVTPLTIGNTTSNSNKSNEVYLKSLEIEDGKLSPSFDKRVTKYTATLDGSKDKINIIAKPEKSSYEVKGDGEFDINDNDSKFEVEVTDDEGNSKTYTISLEANKNIKVKVEGKEYILISDPSKFENIPEGFVKKKITINGQSITALYNEKTEQTLVVLKDDEGNMELYLYDKEKDSYTKYEVINFNKMSFIPIDTKETIKGYSKKKITIDGKEIECLKLSGNSEFSLIYGMNAKNGDKGWYSYESISNTLQKYNDEIAEHYTDREQSTRVLIYILAGTSILFGIMVIILAVKLSQKKKRY